MYLLVLYAEHEFNASTFTGRVCASTMSDIHSCVVAAIGSLRGPFHGGANEKAMELIENWTSRDEAKEKILSMLANKEKIMGFGHAVYSIRDPRNAVIKEYAKELSLLHENDDLYQVAEEVEKVMADEKKMFANADFFHAPAYFYMGIPTKLFTPIFVMSRVSGWTAHCMEQRANNRIIRPSADYIGVESSEWVDIEDRILNMSSNVDLNIRPGYDSVISEIADYVSNFDIESDLALDTARNCLIDTIGCGLLALKFPACTKMLGPVVEGSFCSFWS